VQETKQKIFFGYLQAGEESAGGQQALAALVISYTGSEGPAPESGNSISTSEPSG